MFGITTKEDTRIIDPWVHKLATVPNGCGVATSDLANTRLKSGTPIGRDTETGLWHVVKSAKVVAAVGATGKAITVEKGHQFKVGDKVFTTAGGAAYAITAIAPSEQNGNYDIITIGTTLGALAVGDVIYESATSGAEVAAFKYEPEALLSTDYDVDPGQSLFVGAVLIGTLQKVALQVPLNAAVIDKLKGIILI